MLGKARSIKCTMLTQAGRLALNPRTNVLHSTKLGACRVHRLLQRLALLCADIVASPKSISKSNNLFEP